MPHCTADYPWYLTKFALGFASIIFFYTGNSHASAVLGDDSGRGTVENETIAVSAEKDSTLRYGTDADAEERSRLKISMRTAPRKDDHKSSWMRQSAAAREKNNEIAQPLCRHMKRRTPGITRHPIYEAREESAVMTTSKRRRSSTVGFGGRRPQRFSRCKRDKRYDRSSKRPTANCSLNQARSREIDRLPNKIKVASQSADTCTVPPLSNNEEEKHNKDVKASQRKSNRVANAFCRKFDTSRARCGRGQGMQTISEEDLASPDKPDDEIIDRIVGENNGQEENLRISEQKPIFHSRTSNQTSWGTGEEPRFHSRVRCSSKHSKCSRCSQYCCYESGGQSVPKDNSKSLISTTRTKKMCRLKHPCTRSSFWPYNQRVSLDAFRSREKSSTLHSSILWKVATVIYEISGVIKDGLTKLMAQDEDAEGSCCGVIDGERKGIVSKGTRLHEWKDKRNAGKVIERATECNWQTWQDPVAANPAEDEVTERTIRRSSASKIPTASDYHDTERDSFGTKYASVGCTAKLRKTNFGPKITSSGSTISSLSSSSSFGNSCSATENDRRVEKEARIYSRQDSADPETFTMKEATVGLNKGNFGFPAESTDTKTNLSAYEYFQSYDATDACDTIGNFLTDVGDMPADEIRDDTDESDVSSSVPTVVPAKIYDMQDFKGASDTSDYRAEYSESRSQDGKSFRDEMCYDFKKTSYADSVTSLNYQHDRRPKRKFNNKLSPRTREDRSLLSRKDSLLGRNCSAVKRVSRTDCGIVRPYETFVPSHIEYFKDIGSEDAREEFAMPSSACSKIPRLVRQEGVSGREAMISNVSNCRCCGLESSGSGGEFQHSDQKFVAEHTALANRRIQVSSRASRSSKSASHHFCV